MAGLAALSLLPVLSACTPAPIERPAEVVLDREASGSRRLAALTLLLADPTDASHQRALHDLLWSDRQPTDMRLAALDALARADPADFAAVARQRIVEVDQWDVLGPLLDRGVAEGWPGWASAVVRSWARPSQVLADADRPERALLAQLAGTDDVERAVFELVAGQWGEATLGERVAGWELLSRLTDEPQRRQWLLDTPGSGLLTRSLREAAVALGELPATQQQLLWLLATDLSKSPGLAERPALRHLAVLQAGDDQRNREALLQAVTARLARATAVQRTEGGMMQTAPIDESLATHADRLSRHDLLVIDRVLAMLGDRSLVAELFGQADADLADTQSEHGGVLRLAADGRPKAVAYEPMTRLHDHIFVPPTSLVTALYTGVAHYHFHAQQHANAPYAGPGAGDLAFADRYGATCLVLTFIDRDTLNVDLYQPDGIVIDLGVIRR